jgi:hypothetical protein
LRDIHVAGASFYGRNTVYPRRIFLATDRQSCDTTFIGTNPRDLNPNQKKIAGQSGSTDSMGQLAWPRIGQLGFSLGHRFRNAAEKTFWPTRWRAVSERVRLERKISFCGEPAWSADLFCKVRFVSSDTGIGAAARTWF